MYLIIYMMYMQLRYMYQLELKVWRIDDYWMYWSYWMDVHVCTCMYMYMYMDIRLYHCAGHGPH